MFKKKKGEKSEKGGSSPGKSPYPTQAAAAYPTQQSAAPPSGPPPYNYAAAGPPPGQPPMYAPPGTQPYSYAGGPQCYSGGMPPPGPAMYGPPPPQPMQQPTTYVVQGGFDAGARFDGISQPNIPPPPPGCAPNVAQMAAYQGHNVVVTQRPSGFWEGGSDGGFTLF